MNHQKKIGDCESCSATNVEINEWIRGMWQCEVCHAKDVAHNSPEAQQARGEQYKADQLLLVKAREIDDSIEVKTDLFNAATVAIVSLKAQIDNDETIVNKPYALASELKNRFEHFKDVVFELNQKLIEAGNEQKAIQVYLNNLANSLRSEEREKLKIADINYKPNVVKPAKIKSIGVSGNSKKKATKAEIKAAAEKIGIAEFTLASFVLMSGGDLEAAVTTIQNSIKKAKGE